MTEREEAFAALLDRAHNALERQLVEFERMNAKWSSLCQAQGEELARLHQLVAGEAPDAAAPLN